MTNPQQVAVLGGGSFGTAIANIAASNGHKTYQWMRNKERAAKVQQARENSEYLPGYKLSDNLTACADLQEAVGSADVVFIAIPSKSFREVTQLLAPILKSGTMVISTTKGIEPSGFTLMSQVLEQELNDARIGVLSGPNFAKEIVAHQQTGSVIASEDEELISCIQELLCSSTFRLYANSDRYGVELGGALKNIYAIVTGLATALGCGHNTIAMLLTRSLAEMGRFAKHLDADPLTFLGLAGVGDLILTCTSDLSRNYRLGMAIAQGQSLQQAEADIGQAVEGVNTLRLVKQKADELGVYMPLASALHGILFEDYSIGDVADKLMGGEQNNDVEYSQKNL
ncbi:NAD(P)H-dependent glycerol-3-phosphate dehydrogenase [Pseudoteredinibacter isoporae]|uniref:Glycerol-3-phosphate dehydrogenase [NAD(P)+] n=1 Tax=Pseudoteredinibacter isoporae TaxID=570281 RepID=A0A7X0JW70_9GAMM|nr:NAD(P)H-dependent glycerol-3-phosphate dehydrogenase [Pseudoteredinibacter isoporae]MBB6523377.1 glycerol-3-phosphate dehydrogenase (NAD(P)+) [Pseudoteredinibacter isoporae]NHO88889.1 NAD(P)H-dependent glycerol-3-phosphate dehydrogenase [Pseudoteredinibacter isoporae]NIB24403.1 NAD(P)H-dependent glycerol-3-phosphate dehydrogenase [Pseudoteredinibacter isoporae]